MVIADLLKRNVRDRGRCFGYPRGESSARILISLYYALKWVDKEFSIESICGGKEGACAVVMGRET